MFSQLFEPPALSVHSAHDNCETSQAFCTPRDEIADSFRLSALHARQLGSLSRSLHPSDDICRQPLCALSVHSSHDNCGAFQAFCTPMVSFADSFRLSVLTMHSTHDNCGTSQAFCTPMVSSADSLRLCALPVRSIHDPMMKFADILRLCALLCSPFTKIAQHFRLSAPP